MTPETLIDEVQRRLDTFHSPSFDREIVEQLLALARCSAASAEPAVAWQFRRQVGRGGMWTPWADAPADTAEHYRSLNRTDIEVRALYAAPPPSPVASEEMIERALSVKPFAGSSCDVVGVIDSGINDIAWESAMAENPEAETLMRAALNAALSHAPAGEAGWRADAPPKDHIPILAWAIEYGRVVAFQDATWQWWPCPAAKPLPCPPTHWKPLDKSPNHPISKAQALLMRKATT